MQILNDNSSRLKRPGHLIRVLRQLNPSLDGPETGHQTGEEVATRERKEAQCTQHVVPAGGEKLKQARQQGDKHEVRERFPAEKDAKEAQDGGFFFTKGSEGRRFHRGVHLGWHLIHGVS